MLIMQDLPKKTERIEWCEMTESQSTHYREVLQRSRSQATVTASEVLMDLRKAAIHPVLFRREFTDALIKEMARACKQDSDELFRDSVEEFIVEDMSVMTDLELQHFCKAYKCVAKFSQPDDMFQNSGKIKKLIELLDGFAETKRRVLVFSQFTQVLDILRAVLDRRGTKYLVVTGQTAFDARLGLVDEFNQDESISVFLLSTNAGGMGFNLTAASVVILFDQNLNPHNDKQAADSAYRIGQQNDVDVIKLISKGTIEEDIMRLVEALAAEGAAPLNADESAAEKQIKASLVESIKRQLDAPPPLAPVQGPSEDVKADEDAKEDDGADDLKTEDE